ncbi:patatin-like phospholipase family protein [Aquabacter sp. CN5-332]|uniref:patatin-like phospholipase family protein n=1 Tax=Aquabacter sp. CN5-332 TaxID=3156608 RepID=UPI0032B622C0
MTVLLGTATFVMLPEPAKAPSHPIERPFGSHVLKTAVEWSEDPPAELIAASKLEVPGDRPLRVLMISMGGEYAAYGAGMLTASGEQPGWLDFDIVTGVSAGGLLATFAFAHALEPEAMKRRLGAFAAAVEEADSVLPFIEAWRVVLGRGTTVANNLQAVAGAMIDDALVEKIAQQQRAGRRLFVSSTDLTTGEAIVWDIGLIAASDLEDRVARVRSALLASMTVPVLFAPRSIGARSVSTWHVDGGVMHPFFVSGIVRAMRSGQRDMELDFLLNGKLRDPIEVADISPRPDKVTARALKLLQHVHWRSTLQVLLLETAMRGLTVRVAAIPSEVALPEHAVDFAAPVMIGLFEDGLQRSRQVLAGPGGDDALWQRLTPKSIGAERMLPETLQLPATKP